MVYIPMAQSMTRLFEGERLLAIFNTINLFNDITLSYIRVARCSYMVRPFAHGTMGRRIDPSLSYFSFQPVLHDWCNKSRGTCYPVCGMVHIKEYLLLIGKSSPCGGSGFPFSLSEWSFTI